MWRTEVRSDLNNDIWYTALQSVTDFSNRSFPKCTTSLFQLLKKHANLYFAEGSQSKWNEALFVRNKETNIWLVLYQLPRSRRTAIIKLKLHMTHHNRCLWSASTTQSYHLLFVISKYKPRVYLLLVEAQFSGLFFFSHLDTLFCQQLV